MGLRRCAFLLVCALLGAAVAVLPAVAGSETAPSISAESNATTCGALYPNCFSPSHVELTAPATVGFQNASGVAHGVIWSSVPVEPTCSGVPVGAGNSAASFKGSCSFPETGTYRLYCSVHGPTMSATIVVNPSGTTTTTTTTGPQPGPATSTSPITTSTGAPSTPSPGAGASPDSTPSGIVVALARGQRGRVVRGSLQVPAADAGGRLEVDLLAARAALARSRGSSGVRVGRLVRSSLRIGRLSFAVALDTRGRAALSRHRRLALVLRVALAPPHGSPAVTSRRVVLHP